MSGSKKIVMHISFGEDWSQENIGTEEIILQGPEGLKPALALMASNLRRKMQDSYQYTTWRAESERSQ